MTTAKPGGKDTRQADADDVRAQYERRKNARLESLYALSRQDAFLTSIALDRAIHRALTKFGCVDYRNTSVLEVGSGNGDNLLRFIRWGFEPCNVEGIDLIPERVAVSRERLPVACRIMEGDAASTPIGRTFDLVYQGTVLSSLLDSQYRAEVAATMWQQVKPGGLIMSYDMAFNNPRNKDVSRVGVDELKSSFKHAETTWHQRITLAPPIGRAVARSTVAYRALEMVPLLRSHILFVARKSRASS